MRPLAKSALGFAAALLVIMAGLQPATAACKKMGFLVNDYGKEGPTKDAQRLLDKHIAAWADEQGIEEYTVGKKTVKCELYLNLIVFDEHTCTASATVCWGGSKQPKTQTAKKKKSSKKKTAKATKTKKSKVVKTVATDAVPKAAKTTKTVKAAPSGTASVETGTISKAVVEPPQVPYAADAVIRNGGETTAEPRARVQSAVAKPANQSGSSDRAAVDRAAAAAERAAAAAERAAAAAQQAAEAAKQAAAARAAVVAPVVPTSAQP